MADQPNKRTHAQRRKAEADDGIRRRMRASRYVRAQREIAEKAETVEPSMIPALRLKADIFCKLLAKCLPDLKAVEHSGTVNHINYDAAVIGMLNGRSAEAGDAASSPDTTH